MHPGFGRETPKLWGSFKEKEKVECLRPLRKERRTRKKVFVTGAISQRACQELWNTSQVFSHLLAEMPDFLP